MKKYKITLYLKPSDVKYDFLISYAGLAKPTEESYIGIGRPSSTPTEIMIKQEDGVEIIKFRENYLGFRVEHYND